MTTVVLLPGMDGTGSLFADFISALKAKTIVVSYPGDRPLGYVELQDLVRRSLPSGEPFIIVGESFSGPIAIALASSAPSTLRAVVLICSFARLPGPRLPRVIQQLVASVPMWRAPIAIATKVLVGRFDSQGLRAQLASAMRGVTSAVWRSRLRSVLAVDTTPELTRVQVPILYLRASEDRVVLRSASELILRHNTKVKVMEIEGPHLLLQAKPREAAAAVREFAHELGITL